MFIFSEQRYNNVHLSLGGEVVMNKISKIGLFILLLNIISMIALILLNQTIPDFIMYVFLGSMIVTIAGAMINRRKNQLP